MQLTFRQVYSIFQTPNISKSKYVHIVGRCNYGALWAWSVVGVDVDDPFNLSHFIWQTQREWHVSAEVPDTSDDACDLCIWNGAYVCACFPFA